MAGESMTKLKTLKDAMDEWDQEDAVRFIHNLHSSQERIAVGPSYTPSEAALDRLAAKINILAELVDQKIDLLLKEMRNK